jgi:hypothetical protein
MLEEDYVTRMIKDMVRAVVKTILGKTELNYELPKENECTSDDVVYKKLVLMADAGDINGAENLLLTEFEFEDLMQLEIALVFYSHINEYEEDFLEANNYSRREIGEGIDLIAKKYGYSGIMNVMIDLQGPI